MRFWSTQLATCGWYTTILPPLGVEYARGHPPSIGAGVGAAAGALGAAAAAGGAGDFAGDGWAAGAAACPA